METEKKTTKEKYEAPIIQLVEVEVEQGFQMTGPEGPGGNPYDDGDIDGTF